MYNVSRSSFASATGSSSGMILRVINAVAFRDAHMLHKKILKEAWAATEHMTDDELEQAVYDGECWFEEMMIKK